MDILAAIIELILCVCAFWIIIFLSTFLHELGHALGYRIAAGRGPWHIRVGMGAKLLDTKRLTVKLLPFDGCFTPEKREFDTKAKLITVLAGGPFVSLLLVIGLLLLKFGGVSLESEILAPGAVESFVSGALSLNVFILIMTLLPTHYFYGETKGMETDGLKIIHTIQGKKEQPAKENAEDL